MGRSHRLSPRALSPLAAALAAGALTLTGCTADGGFSSSSAVGSAPATPSVAQPAGVTDTANTDTDELADPASDLDSPVSTSLPPAEDADAEDLTLPTPDTDVEPAEELENEHVAGWHDYEVTSEDEIRFFTTTGNLNCYGLRYEVEESDDEVAVAIIGGRLPDAPEVCTMEAVFVGLPVELDEPLGDRELVELEDPDLNS